MMYKLQISLLNLVVQGHELALHVLYQLYAEKACSTLDVAASTSAAYDQFLLSLVRLPEASLAFLLAHEHCRLTLEKLCPV